MQFLIDALKSLFGIGADSLTVWNVLARCVVIYVYGIALVRFVKKRFIGKMTAFDTIIAIIIGSLLSRAVTNTGNFLQLLAACFLLIFLHRGLSRIAATSDSFGDLIKGHDREVVRDGEVLWEQMKKSNLSKQDLMQNLRLSAKTNDAGKVKTARLERNGDISVIMKDDKEG